MKFYNKKQGNNKGLVEGKYQVCAHSLANYASTTCTKGKAIGALRVYGAVILLLYKYKTETKRIIKAVRLAEETLRKRARAKIKCSSLINGYDFSISIFLSLNLFG